MFGIFKKKKDSKKDDKQNHDNMIEGDGSDEAMVEFEAENNSHLDDENEKDKPLSSTLNEGEEVGSELAEGVVFFESEASDDCEVKSDDPEPIENKYEVEEIENQPEEEVGVIKNTAEKENKKAWFSKLKFGLGKSSSKLNDGLKNIFSRRKLDDDALEDLEDLLIMSDLGAATSSTVIGNLAKNKFDKEITAEEIKSELSNVIEGILQNVAIPLEIESKRKPQVILVCGVNGAGKTTTIGKLSSKWKKEGKSVMIAACDTFRAAAVEQLEVWANRSECEIVKGKEASDPASVAYSAYQRARDENYDILVIDTAGRLQNKKNLMEQLSKIVTVIKKIDDSAPHNSLIVLDATTGQNANSQVKIFGDMVDLNGIIVTKLDGTAKGGVVVSLAQQFEIPIHAIGVGEGIDDLNPFEAKSFADSLVG